MSLSKQDISHHFRNFIWVISVLTAISGVIAYAFIPGRQGQPQVPEKTLLPLGKAQPTFILFLHPKCSCSRATIEEFMKLLPDMPGTRKIVVHNVLEKGWSDGEFWQQLSNVKEILQFADTGGKETKLYGVETSGHAILLDENHHIVFNGGITPYRGHPGANTGSAFIRQWHRERGKSTLISKVFGCGLFGE